MTPTYEEPSRIKRAVTDWGRQWLDSTPSVGEARRNVGDALGIRGRNNGR
jgi:hypothetical protein